MKVELWPNVGFRTQQLGENSEELGAPGNHHIIMQTPLLRTNLEHFAAITYHSVAVKPQSLMRLVNNGLTGFNSARVVNITLHRLKVWEAKYGLSMHYKVPKRVMI